MAQDRDQWMFLVNTVINFRVPQQLGNFLNSSASISLSKKTLLREVTQSAASLVNLKQGKPILLAAERFKDFVHPQNGKHKNEPSGFIKDGEFLDNVSDYQLLSYSSLCNQFSQLTDAHIDKLLHKPANCCNSLCCVCISSCPAKSPVIARGLCRCRLENGLRSSSSCIYSLNK